MHCRIRDAALAATTILSSLQHVTAIQVNVDSYDSVKSAASTVTHAMMQWYTGNLTGMTPGLLGGEYYWWEAGALMGTLMDYWAYTGDSTYNEVVTQAMLFQASPTENYMPANQTQTEGNDDQVFWGFAAMTASEFKFPNPPEDQPQWLALAQGVWNSMQLRWDTSHCGGGLRWQIFTWNAGYDYKNSPSNAGFINLGARLHAYTGNQTYADWVEKTWQWMEGIGLIAANDGTPGVRIYDGSKIADNCSTIHSYVQWTYSAGMLLNAAAVMWNVTQDPVWEDRANAVWASSYIFFTKDKILWEVACERPGGSCNVDQLSFKSYFIRWMAASTKWMPQLYDQMQPYFEASGNAAAQACVGTIAGLYGNACGFKWFVGGWDGTYGYGQQMDALQALMSNIIQEAPYPVTSTTGGITSGDPSAGTEGDDSAFDDFGDITAASKAGASILTAFIVVSWLGTIWWMFI